jgi:acetyl esterase/lipase
MRSALLASILTLLISPILFAADAAPQIIELWPTGKVPGEKGELAEKKTEKNGVVTSITDVSRPTIEVHLPPKDKATGVAIVIAPGGGYKNLAWDHEGEQIATWANSAGMAGIILKYRVPRRADQPQDQPPIGALQDAQRAMGIVRSHASEWGFDAKKVGFLGFSAGGHLTAWISTNCDKRAYEAVDDADKQSCRPDFSVMIYPGGVVEKGTINLKPEIKITKDVPPGFLAVAANDQTDNSIAIFQGYKQAGVTVEMHIFAKGGHGFGIRPQTGAAATWPARCQEWLQTIGVLQGPFTGLPAPAAAKPTAAK